MSTIQKKLELSNLPSRDHEPQPSTSTSKAPESDTLLTTPSPSDVERIPIVISGDGELEETYAPLPKKRQLSIVQSMERKYSYLDGGKDYLKLCKCLLYFICVDKRPFDIVKGRGFKKLMHQACPSFKIPHVDTLKAQFEHFYSVMRLKVENIFDNVDHVALTCDIWSEVMTVTSYLGVTAHYLQEDKLVSRCIATVALDQRHTGDFIADKLKEICAGIHISLDKITAVVTDNGSNMIAGIANFLEKNKHLPCFAHTINLIAESAMSVNDLGALVSMVRDIVKFFKSSVILSDFLRQKQTGSQPLKLILDVKTRWNSVYYMLQRYIELAPIVHQILMLNTKAPPTPSAVEMQNIKTLICILKLLEYVTKELSGEQYVTISKIIPMVNCLKTQINNIPMAVGDGDGPHGRVIDTVKKEILKQIERRFGHIEDNYLIAMSCLLDPRFKNIHFQDAKACAKAISLLRRYITTSPSVIGSDHDSDSSLETTYDFWSHHKKLAHTKQRSKTSSSSQFENKDEISHYLSTQVSPLSLNPLKQWEDMKVVFPKLYKLARQFLSIPATSVPSERLFSKAGSTITKTRNRLSPKRLDKLLFLSDCTEEEWDL